MFTDKCPVCDSVDWTIDDTEIVGDCKIETCYCDQCSSTWKEKWVFVENYNIVDARMGVEN